MRTVHWGSKETPMASPTIGNPSVLKGLNILVVEDNMLIADAIADAIATHGGTVIGPVARAKDALSLALSAELDVAVLDVNLSGGGGGLPVAEALAKRRIPFVFITGYDDVGVLTPAFRHRPRLTKPFRTDKLLEMLVNEAM